MHCNPCLDHVSLVLRDEITGVALALDAALQVPAAQRSAHFNGKRGVAGRSAHDNAQAERSIFHPITTKPNTQQTHSNERKSMKGANKFHWVLTALALALLAPAAP